MNRNSKMPYRSALKAPPKEQSSVCQPATVRRGPGLRPPQTRSGIPSASTGLPVPRSGIPSARTGLPVPRSGIPARTPKPASSIPSGNPRSGIPTTAQRGLRLPQAGRLAQAALPEARGRSGHIAENTSRPTRLPPLGDTRCPRRQQAIHSKSGNQAMSSVPAAVTYNPPVSTLPARNSLLPTPASTCRNTPVHLTPQPASPRRYTPGPPSLAHSHPMRNSIEVSPANTGVTYNNSETPARRITPARLPGLRRVIRMDESICEPPPQQMTLSEPYSCPTPVEPSPVRLVDLSVDETNLSVQEDQEREELNNALSVVQSVRRSYLQNMPQNPSSSPAQLVGSPYDQILMRRIEEFGGYVPDLDEEEMPEYMYSDELEEELNPLHEWCRQPYSEPSPAATDDLIDMDTDPWTYSTELYRLVQF